LGTTVSDIELLKNGKYSLTFKSNGKKDSKEYDYVILASPIEFCNITFKNIPISHIHHRPYVTWNVYVIEAEGLNPEYFKINPVPDIVLTSKNSTAPFHTVNVRSVNKTTGKKIYKIFSNEILKKSDLEPIFQKLSDYFEYRWDGVFPSMKPPKKGENYQPLILSKNLYYINTIESIATAMGGSTIASQNIARLIVKDLSQMK